jgi:hypothetical protein
MHVETEGNLKVHLYAFLYTCHSKGWLRRQKLNGAILAFHWPGGAYVPEIMPATLKGHRAQTRIWTLQCTLVITLTSTLT